MAKRPAGRKRSNLCFSELRLFWEKIGRQAQCRKPQTNQSVSFEASASSSPTKAAGARWTLKFNKEAILVAVQRVDGQGSSLAHLPGKGFATAPTSALDTATCSVT